ncbi:hypothetical protein BB560_000466 [Smittium megazygosporum]|uniref:Uncharacterized protein n=1 Tax=Smittium megazygosporum TaxID=133381 RepID=A0A2T9ZK72_9FUNG|nr:hypothetical protein BB560_000466 [Smittium megazygosporum]
MSKELCVYFRIKVSIFNILCILRQNRAFSSGIVARPQLLARHQTVSQKFEKTFSEKRTHDFRTTIVGGGLNLWL